MILFSKQCAQLDYLQEASDANQTYMNSLLGSIELVLSEILHVKKQMNELEDNYTQLKALIKEEPKAIVPVIDKPKIKARGKKTKG